MRRTFFFIFTFFELVSVVGCRASREMQTTQQWHQSSNIDVEAHRLDSLWSLLVERYHVHIEYYAPNEVRQPETDTTKSLQSPAKANWPVAAPSVGQSPGFPLSGIGGLGAVKSIDIDAERTQSEQSLSQADSSAVCKTESESAQKTEKASQARQDNGTVIGVAIVFAVGLIVYLLLKEFLKP